MSTNRLRKLSSVDFCGRFRLLNSFDRFDTESRFELAKLWAPVAIAVGLLLMKPPNDLKIREPVELAVTPEPRFRLRVEFGERCGLGFGGESVFFFLRFGVCVGGSGK